MQKWGRKEKRALPDGGFLMREYLAAADDSQQRIDNPER